MLLLFHFLFISFALFFGTPKLDISPTWARCIVACRYQFSLGHSFSAERGAKGMDVLQTGLQANTSQTPGQKRFLELEPKFNVAVTSIFNYDDDFPRQSPVANRPVRVGRLERPLPGDHARRLGNDLQIFHPWLSDFWRDSTRRISFPLMELESLSNV